MEKPKRKSRAKAQPKCPQHPDITLIDNICAKCADLEADLAPDPDYETHCSTHGIQLDADGGCSVCESNEQTGTADDALFEGATAEQLSEILDGAVDDLRLTKQPIQRRLGCPDCSWTGTVEEAQEHVDGTGHELPTPVEPEQTALFAEHGVVHRTVRKEIPDYALTEARKELADLYLQIRDEKEAKKVADDGFNLRIKALEAKIEPFAKMLQDPFDEMPVDCEWRIDQENPTERILVRLDTEDVLDRKPLTAEERASMEIPW